MHIFRIFSEENAIEIFLEKLVFYTNIKEQMKIEYHR